MLKRFLMLVDTICLGVAFVTSYSLLPYSRPLIIPGEPVTLSPLRDYTWLLLIILPTWLGLLNHQGLYSPITKKSYCELMVGIFKSTVISLIVVAAASFALREQATSRLLMLLFALLSMFLLTGLRIATRFYAGYRQRKGYYPENLLIVGSPEQVEAVLRVKNDLQPLDTRIVGYLDTSLERPNSKILGVQCLGTVRGMRNALLNNVIDEVVFMPAVPLSDQWDKILTLCEQVGIKVRIVPDFVLPDSHRKEEPPISRATAAEDFWGLPSITFSPIPYKADQLFVKRILDIVISATSLVLLFPLFLLMAVVIKLTSPGPVLYPWRVVGRNNREFLGYKFRSMVVNADQMKADLIPFSEMTGPTFKMKNDPRVTPLGRVLRKFSLDELPQLWSVLKGDMSLVGPRPAARSELERFEFWQRRKLSIKPGMICLWHVKGKPQDFNEWARLDLEYIEHWSIWLDLEILLKTIPYMLLGKNY